MLNMVVEATAVRGCRCVLSRFVLGAHCGASPSVLDQFKNVVQFLLDFVDRVGNLMGRVIS